MKQIETVSLIKVRNAEHYQFHTNILNLITEEDAVALNIKDFRDAYILDFTREEEVFKIARGFEETPEIIEIDRHRDKLFSYMQMSVRLNLNETDPLKVEAAEKLNFIFRQFGNLTKKPFYEESALLTKLCMELKKPEIAPYTNTLNLMGKVDETLQVNKEFIELYTTRHAGLNQDEVNFKELRNSTDSSFKKIVQAINSMQIVYSQIAQDASLSSKVEELIAGINGHIRKLKEIYSIRNTRLENSKLDDDNVGIVNP